MNTQNEELEVNSAYNPFPEPQTIPSGWDTSVFYAAPTAYRLPLTNYQLPTTTYQPSFTNHHAQNPL